MQNVELAGEYVRRAKIRLAFLDALFEEGSWPDVVRESHKILELSLKGLLRRCGVDPPPVRDVSDVLLAEKDRLPADLIGEAEVLAAASRHLRRDRELAFYGAQDLTPTGFYSRVDAEAARAAARRTVEAVYPHVMGGDG